MNLKFKKGKCDWDKKIRGAQPQQHINTRILKKRNTIKGREIFVTVFEIEFENEACFRSMNEHMYIDINVYIYCAQVPYYVSYKNI